MTFKFRRLLIVYLCIFTMLSLPIFSNEISYQLSDSSPQLVDIEGYLQPTGSILLNGDYDVTLSLYRSSTTNIVATYSQTIPFFNNYFRVQLEFSDDLIPIIDSGIKLILRWLCPMVRFLNFQLHLFQK